MERDRVYVRRRDGGRFESDANNVAVEAGFYDMPDGAGGVSKWIEAGLADIDSMGAKLFRQIEHEGRLPGREDTNSATLALFVGLQVARTTGHRERALFVRRVGDWLDGRDATPELVA